MTQSKKDIAEEIVDVFNYLIAIANRLEIDLEKAFRYKNQLNQTRTWSNDLPSTEGSKEEE